jgi:hypothetical protein
MSQVLEQDGIYFTESSGKVYINGLLYNADWFFTTEIFYLDEDLVVAKPVWIAKRILTVELEIANQSVDIVRCRVDDCLVMAHIQEELDFFSYWIDEPNPHSKQ